MFNHTVVAGTFDHLHSGHQKLIVTALKSSKKVSVGLTTKKLTQKKPLRTLIQSSSTRQIYLQKYLQSFSTPSSIFSLSTSHGQAPTQTDIDSIIATSQTINTVNQINKLRLRNRLQPLTPVMVDLKPATDKKNLSSTRIRQGQINRLGYAFHQIFPKHKKLTLPPIHRFSFQKPFDTFLSGSQHNLSWASLKAKNIIKKTKPFLTIAVGDIAIISLLQQNIKLNLSVADLKTKRQPVFAGLTSLGLPQTPTYTVVNPPSSITPDLINTLQQSLETLIKSNMLNNIRPTQPQSILVKGEEDLTVLPAILLSPLNTAVFYGQPNQGLVYIKVTETTKQKALNLFNKFKQT